MANIHPSRAEDLLPHIVKLSGILAEFLPHSWDARRFLYCTIFVRVAMRKKGLPRVLDEFEQGWQANPQRLYQLLFELVDMFGDFNDKAWTQVRSDVVSFYNTYNNMTGSITNKVPDTFRPLPSMYHSVRKDLQNFQEKIKQRSRTRSELQLELQAFASRNPGFQCPLPRRYVTIPRITEAGIIWEAKAQAFASIFQRTRELFQFQNEEAHFYHAAAIVEFMHAIAKRKFKPDTRLDEVAFERQAAMLKDFRRVYIGVLEKSQEKLQMDQVVRFVTDNMNLSRTFTSIRNAANKDFEKSKKLLAEGDYVLPSLSNPKSTLSSTLYGMLHVRRQRYDELAHVTDKVAKQLQQLYAWEENTGARRFIQFVPHTGVIEPILEQDGDQNRDVTKPDR